MKRFSQARCPPQGLLELFCRMAFYCVVYMRNVIGYPSHDCVQLCILIGCIIYQPIGQTLNEVTSTLCSRRTMVRSRRLGNQDVSFSWNTIRFFSAMFLFFGSWIDEPRTTHCINYFSFVSIFSTASLERNQSWKPKWSLKSRNRLNGETRNSQVPTCTKNNLGTPAKFAISAKGNTISFLNAIVL